jgi:hypothetical protein
VAAGVASGARRRRWKRGRARAGDGVFVWRVESGERAQGQGLRLRRRPIDPQEVRARAIFTDRSLVERGAAPVLAGVRAAVLALALPAPVLAGSRVVVRALPLIAPVFEPPARAARLGCTILTGECGSRCICSFGARECNSQCRSPCVVPAFPDNPPVRIPSASSRWCPVAQRNFCLRGCFTFLGLCGSLPQPLVGVCDQRASEAARFKSFRSQFDDLSSNT